MISSNTFTTALSVVTLSLWYMTLVHDIEMIKAIDTERRKRI